MADKILVVDDEDKIREVLVPYLRMEGFETSEAADGETALRMLADQSDISLVLLDWMMPGLSGISLLTKMREITNVPIIFLTARTQEVDKLLGLEIGADDYITKPFSIREVAARIRAVLRRSGRQLPDEPTDSGTEDHPVITREDLIIDPSRHHVLVRGTEAVLTPTEFNLLHTLASSPGRVYSRLQLLESALGEEYAGYERSIDTHIRNLRKKIEADPANPRYIVTVFGIGYKFGAGQ